MAERSGIEWCDSTWTPWSGCTEISDGCANCWARETTHGAWGKNPRARTTRAYWRLPILWNVDAPRFQREHGRPRIVFGGHICDVFDNQAPDEWRVDFFRLIRDTPRLIWQLLTKRPQNITKMLPPDWSDGYRNVWLGISAEDQHYFDQRWKVLSAIPARIRFVSYEPALGPMSLLSDITMLPDWVICGGESGKGARYMEPAWARALRDQCRELGVAFFMKQMTSKTLIPSDLMVREFPKMMMAEA